MTLIIVAILLLSFILIATERLTNINKAAVAVFAGTVGWVLYICWGTDFVMSQHPSGYFNFLQGAVATSTAVKQYIAKSIFLPYVGKASEVVLFLLATMTIVEVLYNNGCFDFITQILKTRNSKRMLWTLVIITFLVSINLDNLTTTVMMLTIMHGIIPSRRQRMILGSAILIAATAGGTLTVIGNPENLVLWNMGAVTASNLSATLLVPCVTTCVVSVLLLQRMLPDRLDTEWIVMPYRGDDTNLNVWQRLLMLFVGLGGLWLIPTLHDITKLSPFLGAFCVLAVLWIVNEIINRKDALIMMYRATGSNTTAEVEFPDVLSLGRGRYHPDALNRLCPYQAVNRCSVNIRQSPAFFNIGNGGTCLPFRVGLPRDTYLFSDRFL